MAFTDEDLKRLKESLDADDPDCLNLKDFNALLCRLEAAEAVATDYVDKADWLCPTCNGIDVVHRSLCATYLRLRAWRKAKGEAS